MLTDDRQLELVERLTAAFADEIERHEPAASVPWPWWPDVRTLVAHVGGVHAWAARIVTSGERALDPVDRPAVPDAGMRGWYLERRAELLEALRSVPVDAPCWVIASGAPTAGFWRRRMVFETTKHLVDLRAAGGGIRQAPDELTRDDYADGVDELLEVFLPRSRPTLAPLPAAVLLDATDVCARRLIRADWSVAHDADDPAGARIRATASDLAMLVWERADLDDPERFDVSGHRAAAEAFAAAPIHP